MKLLVEKLIRTIVKKTGFSKCLPEFIYYMLERIKGLIVKYVYEMLCTFICRLKSREKSSTKQIYLIFGGEGGNPS